MSVTPLTDRQSSVASAVLSSPRLEGERATLDAFALLEANLRLIDRIVTAVTARKGVTGEDIEEFRSIVRLKLLENDCEILRLFEGRSSLGTYLHVVVQRLLLDHRTTMWGKWHSSAEARRLGESAIELETMMRRDGRTFDESAAAMMARNPALTRAELEEIAARLPHRAPRRREVEIGEAAAVASADDPVAHFAASATSQRVSVLIREYLAQLDEEDRLVLGLRFDGDMTVAQIARSLRMDQKQLYRRIDKHLRALRQTLETHGIASAEIDGLIHDPGTVLDFRLESASPRQKAEERP